MSRTKSIDRNRVLDAAEDIVVQLGAGELTIDAVAKAAGITKGGVQSCFGTKENMVSAMLQRWGDAYDEAGNNLVSPEAGRLSPVLRHIRVTATATTLNAKAASLLAALLQSKEQTTWLRDWYLGHFSKFDTSTDEGRRTRLAFLATEGAFMLRYMGLVDMSDVEWRDIFDDIEHCAEHTVATDTSAPDLKGQAS